MKHLRLIRSSILAIIDSHDWDFARKTDRFDFANRVTAYIPVALNETAAELARAKELLKRIADALGTGEEGDALVEVAQNAHNAEQELAGVYIANKAKGQS